MDVSTPPSLDFACPQASTELNKHVHKFLKWSVDKIEYGQRPSLVHIPFITATFFHTLILQIVEEIINKVHGENHNQLWQTLFLVREQLQIVYSFLSRILLCINTLFWTKQTESWQHFYHTDGFQSYIAKDEDIVFNKDKWLTCLRRSTYISWHHNN
jgi:hypothetical protein